MNKNLILKVATYNIQHGLAQGSQCTNIAKEIVNNNIDIIGIQEADLFISRSGKQDIIKTIAQTANYPYYQFYKTIDYQDGDYGLGIISKYPFKTINQQCLSHCKEQRIIVNTEVDINQTKLNFLVTHLDLGTYEYVRKYQFNEVAELVEKLKSFVLTGDFNVNNWNNPDNPLFEYQEYLGKYNLVNNQSQCYLSYSGKPQIGGGISPLDNIITSKNIEIIKSEMIDTDYSDHDMIVAGIKIKIK